MDAGSLKDIIKDHISTAKNEGLTPQQYHARIRDDVSEADNIINVFVAYEQQLKNSNAMDFDDLLHKTKELLLSCPDVLENLQNRFQYVNVDEFQDTNSVQFDIVQMLSAKHGNLFVVGDDDQSIYGWRGAKVENILNFDKIYPNAKIHKLFQNYRSTQSILDCANNIIRNNTARHEKELFTSKKGGVKVEYYTAYNDRQETEWIVETIKSLKRFNGCTNKDIAILIRANALSRNFENALSSLRIKYRVLGGFKFFERKEVQDVIAYMRVAINPKDNEAVERIINFPRRGIGETTIERLREYARLYGSDMFTVIQGINTNNALSGAVVNKINDFRLLINDIMQQTGLPLHEFVQYIVGKANFEYAYTSTGKEEDENRLQNIMEFIKHTKEFADKSPTASVSDFLQTVSLVSERSDEERDDDIVTIATMHSVKGLEFKVVFIAACEEDIFPSARSVKEDGVEEERRVMYVAVTRAQERLYITNTRQRFRFNRVQSMLPSRFVDEAKGGQGNKIDELRRKWEQTDYSRNTRYNDDYDYSDTMPSRPSASRGAEAFAPPIPQPTKAVTQDVSAYKLGTEVIHKIYGEGKIIMITGSGSDTQATVMFPTLGIKKFMLAISPLKLKQ